MNRRALRLCGWAAAACILIATLWWRTIVWRETVLGCIEHGGEPRWCMEHTR